MPCDATTDRGLGLSQASLHSVAPGSPTAVCNLSKHLPARAILSSVISPEIILCFKDSLGSGLEPGFPQARGNKPMMCANCGGNGMVSLAGTSLKKDIDTSSWSHKNYVKQECSPCVCTLT